MAVIPVSEVFNEDNITGMKRYPDKFWDLGIVDPPYCIDAANMSMGSNASRKKNGYPGVSTATKLRRKNRLNSGGGAMKNSTLVNSNLDWDKEPPPPEYFEELFRVTKNQIIWGGNYFDLPPTRCIICWDKKQPWDNFSQWEMAWTSFDSPASMFRMSNTGGLNHEKKIHPTEKKIELYRWLIHKYAKPGDKILDTHMGSQSSRIAAYQLGFDYWGFELDKTYFESGCKRFKEKTMQGNLFNQ